MSALPVTPRRRPAERALLEYLRADAWRWTDPAAREASYLDCIRVPGRFDAFELNVLYELLILGSTAESLLEMEEALEAMEAEELLKAIRMDTQYDVARMPLALLISTASVLTNGSATPHSANWVGNPRHAPHGMDDSLAHITIDTWRGATHMLRRRWPGWALPDALTSLIDSTAARLATERTPELAYSMRHVITLASESLLRVAWLFECEERQALAFGPVSDRRLPRDEGEAAVMLRRYAEQQPELRKVPAFVHVAPRDPADWLRPRDYSRLAMPNTDPEQTRVIASDALSNRKYIHDHIAVIEVDRKPLKKIVLAPETFDRTTGIIYLNAIVEHDRGTFAAEVMLNAADAENPRYALALPFGSYAWRTLPDDVKAQGFFGKLPPDDHVAAVIIAAWRDLVVANVKEQQYESEVQREGGRKDGKHAERKARKAQTAVIRYLPRTVVIRRAEAAERLAHEGGPKRQLSRPFRVGTFARMLQPGHKRSAEAHAFAEEIGLPLRFDQTCVRPHIRGGTEEEREALLAEDDVRLWRSWAALDLIHVRANPASVE